MGAVDDAAVTAEIGNTRGVVCVQAVGGNDVLAFQHVEFEEPVICTS